MFFLYLLGDVFYRWDGFKFYGSFSEFLPGLSLISLLWSFVAVFTAIVIWLSVRLLNVAGLCLKKTITADQLDLFMLLTILLGALAWFGKKLLGEFAVSGQHKTIVLLSVVLVAASMAFVFRHKAKDWVSLSLKMAVLLRGRIAPLVWLFSMWIVISIPVVAYNSWFMDVAKPETHELAGYADPDSHSLNILLVTYDALSARNMSLYGYVRDTTPFMSEWSKSASVFTRAKAAGNITAPTTASLMSGKRVWGHKRFNRMESSRPVKMDTESIPLLLKNKGYFNMAFIVNPVGSVENLGVESFFDVAPPANTMYKINNVTQAIHYMLTTVFGENIKLSRWLLQEDFIFGRFLDMYLNDMDTTSYPPELAFNKFFNAIAERNSRPYFAWIHLNPPHSPYLPPEPYMGMFDNSMKMRSYKSLIEETNKMHEVKSEHNELPQILATLKSRYDEFIRYSDNQFEKFIDKMEEEGRLNNTVIILSTDHGEIFEHNRLAHGSSLYEAETHIPLIIRLPDQNKGLVIDELVEQVDISATILELAGIEAPSWIDGMSLLPLINRGQKMGKPAFSMVLEKSPSRGEPIEAGTVAVWEGDFKLIYDLETSNSEVYNLKNDPDEKNNLAAGEPEVSRHLLHLIQEHLRKANEVMLRDQQNS